MERKHITVSRVLHIGKESNNLDESEFLGVDSDSYEIYDDIRNINAKFKQIGNKVLNVMPSDVKNFGISRQTLWNTKKNIMANRIEHVSDKIKMTLISVFKSDIELVAI